MITLPPCGSTMRLVSRGPRRATRSPITPRWYRRQLAALGYTPTYDGGRYAIPSVWPTVRPHDLRPIARYYRGKQ